MPIAFHGAFETPPTSGTYFAGRGCLGVIIPVYNEAGSVDGVMRQVLAQECVAEVIVVDDGSDDGSWERIESWTKQDQRAKGLRHASNRGKGASIRTALPFVSSRWVVIQDADWEYDPHDYASMLAPLLNGSADAVFGSRFLGSHAATGTGHRMINRALTALANCITGSSLTDVHTCLKMFPTALLKELDLQESRFGFCPEITAKLSSLPGFRLVEVPISYRPRTRSEGKKIGLNDGLRAVYCVVRYGWNARFRRSRSV